MTAGIRATPGVLMVPLEAEFGWTRVSISAAVAINIALFGLLGPFAASIMDRWGVRRVLLVALALLAGAVSLSTQMRTESRPDAAVGRAGRRRHGHDLDGAGGDRRHPLVRSAARPGGRCALGRQRHRAVDLPAVLAGLDRLAGWRAATWLVAAAAAVVFLIVAVFMRDRPEDVGLTRYGATRRSDQSRRRPCRHWRRWRAAARSPAFWLLAATFFVCGASTNGLIGTHLIAACHDVGIPSQHSARLLAMMGLFDIAGTMASGWLTDRYSSRHLLLGYYTLRGLSLLALPYTLGGGIVCARLVRGVLRSGLDRHGTADGAPRLGCLRSREHRRHVWLDRREPPGGRVAGRAGRRFDPDDHR